jgi:hypothetical protein
MMVILAEGTRQQSTVGRYKDASMAGSSGPSTY